MLADPGLPIHLLRLLTQAPPLSKLRGCLEALPRSLPRGTLQTLEGCHRAGSPLDTLPTHGLLQVEESPRRATICTLADSSRRDLSIDALIVTLQCSVPELAPLTLFGNKVSRFMSVHRL